MWDLFQNLFLSPLIGAIMGLILGWWFSPPAGQQTTIQFAYTNIVNSFNTTIYNYGVRDEGHKLDEANLVFGGVVLFLYVNYGYLVFQVLAFFATLVVAFDLVFLLSERGEVGWIVNLIWPVLAIAVAGYLLLLAFEIYQAEQANGPMSLVAVVQNLLNRYGLFVLCQAVGTACVAAALFGSGMAITYYACLGSLADAGDINSARWKIAVWARRFSGISGFLRIFILLTMAYLLIEQYVYRWVVG
jgi:hypothetical protein